MNANPELVYRHSFVLLCFNFLQSGHVMYNLLKCWSTRVLDFYKKVFYGPVLKFS